MYIQKDKKIKSNKALKKWKNLIKKDIKNLKKAGILRIIILNRLFIFRLIK